jgi:hypothetical protein
MQLSVLNLKITWTATDSPRSSTPAATRPPFLITVDAQSFSDAQLPASRLWVLPAGLPYTSRERARRREENSRKPEGARVPSAGLQRARWMVRSSKSSSDRRDDDCAQRKRCSSQSSILLWRKQIHQITPTNTAVKVWCQPLCTFHAPLLTLSVSHS